MCAIDRRRLVPMKNFRHSKVTSYVLTQAQCDGIKHHEYAVRGKSIMDEALQPWFNWLVEQVPMWVAPNLITFVGLMVNLISNLLLVSYNPTMDTPGIVPPYLYFVAGISLFLYQSLDNIDGKQARRTGSATPLGELFDHGCDSMSTFIVIVGLLATVQAGATAFSFWVTVIAVSVFYFCHWECYVKGYVQFNTIDVTEAQWAIILIQLATGIAGDAIWDMEFLGFSLRLLALGPANAFALFAMARYYNSIWEGGPGPEGTSSAETGILSPLGPIAGIVAGMYVLYNSTYFAEHPALFILGVGCASAKLTCRLIVAHMSSTKVQQLDIVHAIPVIYWIMHQISPVIIEDDIFVPLALLFFFVDMVWYCVRVCLDMKTTLNIDVFRIPYSPKEEEKKSD
eukprot:m.102471 g.102471  ORF g.102471 m.102471 type:complete len:398 (-) comp13223_c2_seq2:1648-2841(-)